MKEIWIRLEELEEKAWKKYRDHCDWGIVLECLTEEDRQEYDKLMNKWSGFKK